MIVVARFFVPLLAPFSIGLWCVLLGFFCLRAKKEQMAKFVLTLGLGVFIFFGYGLFTKQQLYELERQYPALVIKNIPAEVRQHVHFVVVLGSAHTTDPGVPITGQISGSSLYRLVEEIRIQRLLSQKTLVLSGGINQDPVPNAVAVGAVADLIGVDQQKIILEDRPCDTFEEAELLQPLLGDTPFILVTSASHMVRAMKLFQEAGMQPIPAPTDFILKSNQHLSAENLLPSCANLEISKRVIYEWLGILWGYLKQKTAACL